MFSIPVLRRDAEATRSRWSWRMLATALLVFDGALRFAHDPRLETAVRSPWFLEPFAWLELTALAALWLRPSARGGSLVLVLCGLLSGLLFMRTHEALLLPSLLAGALSLPNLISPVVAPWRSGKMRGV